MSPASRSSKPGRPRFPQRLRDVGYEAVWSGEGSWNGVAILARDRVPVLVRSSLPGDPQDFQARYIEAEVNGILIASRSESGQACRVIRRISKHDTSRQR